MAQSIFLVSSTLQNTCYLLHLFLIRYVESIWYSLHLHMTYMLGEFFT